MIDDRLIVHGPGGIGDPERIRTSDLRFRKPLLYPAELRGRAGRVLARFRARVKAGLVLALLSSCGGVPLDRLAEGERGRVDRVLSGEVMRLEGGLLVRLAGVDAPTGGEPGAMEARALLSRAFAGREAALLYGGDRRDGFDQAIAHVRTVGDRRWAQGALLDAGLARVRTEPGDRALAAEMLRREARARSVGRGLWVERDWRVLLPPEAKPGYILVEGRVTGVERTRLGWRLAFGGSFLGLVVPPRAGQDFTAAGRPLDALEGKLIRVRGVARPVRGGLELPVTHPEQIEVLQPGAG